MNVFDSEAMNPDAPPRNNAGSVVHGSIIPPMTRVQDAVTSEGSRGAPIEPSTSMPYSTSAVNPQSTSSHQGTYSVSSNSSNPIPVLNSVSGYHNPLQMHTATTMEEISQVQPKVSDLVFELASKALQHVKSVQSGTTGSGNQQETKVPDKNLEKHRLHFKVVRFMFHSGGFFKCLKYKKLCVSKLLRVHTVQINLY